MRYLKFILNLSFFLTVVFSSSGVFARDLSKVEITAVKVASNIVMLQGAGGNIGVCVGEDGVFLVDDQFAPLTGKIKAAIARFSSGEIKFVINTHWHFDHVGGNENLGEAGSVIVAHENVRHRMNTEQMMTFFNRKVPPSPKVALPVITFSRDIRFHLNGEEISVFHVKNAHTDGDGVVFFKNANVVHTGDIYFSGIYPFIDTSSKGSVDGVIDAAKQILSRIDDDTRVIPGHGPLSTKAELAVYVEMLENLRRRVARLISQGKTLKEIQDLGPSVDYDSKWGDGFLPPEKFIQILYEDLSDTTLTNTQPKY